jgi:hypothetical protein
MNRRGNAVALTAVTITMMLTGCGGDSTSAEVEEPASSASDPTPSESQEPTATVQQYASVVARSQDLVAHLDEMGACNWTGPGPIGEPGDLTCGLGKLQMEYQAATLRLSLRNAADPEGPKGYIGAPPAELASLSRRR